jgi:hypothetical protein
MYKTGELDLVMDSFEQSLVKSHIYVQGRIDRADKVEIEADNGRISKMYKNQNYYNNGQVNQLFIMFLSGYALGKLESRNQ